MQLKKIILGLILSISYVHVWADDTTTSDSQNTETQTTTTTKPAVILPQDEDEIDAAPDDHEFEVTPEK